MVPVRLLLALLAASWCGVLAQAAPAVASGLSCSHQPASLKLCGARTDNYKDCYNAGFPGAPELRTWLGWFTVQVAGASYHVHPGQAQFPRHIAADRVSGRPGSPRHVILALSAIGGSGGARYLSFRNGPPAGEWGVFLQLTSRSALASSPVAIRILARTRAGNVLGHTTVSYRADAALAGAPPASPEYNGPGGRWYVGSRATRTDVELGTPARC